MTPQSSSFEDKFDVEDADRGFIAALEPGSIEDVDGRCVWDGDQFNFLRNAKCPDTSNPRLWRHSQLCLRQGLFKVVDGIYQVRGLDISNMTLVEGDRGVIVIDPLISVECAKAALSLYLAHRGNRPVTGLIYTHSHADHFGGARGVLLKGDDNVPIIAPEGFLESAVSENIFAGNAMTRRAYYMYGNGLPKAPNGLVGFGLGLGISTGSFSLLPPTVHITETGQEEVVDGVRIQFQLTPGTEAPSEMNFYFPQSRSLCMAENACHTLHNILTLRGAVVRDARMWSRYLDEALELFGQDSDVVFASHHWPTWGTDAIVRFLREQRDLYGYLHDQTLRMMNQGLTGSEIAEEMTLPSALQKAWHAQGFYGSVSHNVKAIYQRYLGWFDGNPAHLWEHPPTQAAERYVSCMGGAAEVISKAKVFATKGDLRFAATLLNHAVYAEPENLDAREALASVYDRLGRGAENGTWRNFYLTGAQELRFGLDQMEIDLAGEEAMEGLTVDQLLDSLAVRLHGPRSQEISMTIDLRLKDLKRQWRLTLSNGVLIHNSVSLPTDRTGSAGLTCTLTRQQLLKVLAGKETLDEIDKEGDPALLTKLLSLLVAPKPMFPIITPRATL